MEHVTENYLEGEQRICDVWSHYINDRNSDDANLDKEIKELKRVYNLIKEKYSEHIG